MTTPSKLMARLPVPLRVAGLAVAAALALAITSCSPKLSGSENASITSTTGNGQIGDPGTDFTLAVAQTSVVVPAGGRGSNGVSVAWINCAPSAIQLDPDGLPPGLTVAFDTDPTPALSSLSIAADPTVPAGTYPIRLMGTVGQILHQTTFDLVVPPVPGFALALSPAALDIPAGGNGKLDVAIQRLGGYTDPVALSLQGAPTGVTGTFTSVPVPAIAGSTVVEEDHSLLLTAAASTAPGTYTLSVHGISNGVDHAVSFFLKVSPVSDFALSLAPAQLSANQTDAVTGASAVAISRASGFTGAITFAVTGAPAGVTPRIAPSPATGAAASLDFTMALPQPGAYPIKVTGTSGAITHTAYLLLTIVPGGPDFQVTAPASTTADLTGLASGTKSFTVPVGVTALSGFNRIVSLSASGLPAGGTAVFNPASVTPTASSNLVLTLPATTRPGTSTITITGDGGSGLVHTTTFQLTVVNPGVFTLSATPNPLSIVIGPLNGAFTGSTTLSVIPANGFNGAVTLSLSALPTGVTAAFGTNPATGTSILTFTATTPAALAGSYPLTITGVSGPLNASTPLTLNLVAGPDFSLAAAPSPLSIQVPTPAASPATGNATVTITAKNGYAKAVTLSMSALPAGVTATFTPASATTTSALTFSVANTATPGSYPLTITGTDGTLTRTTPLTLTLTAAPTFSLSATAGTALPGSSASGTVTVAPVNGFNANVALSLVAPPAGITATFAPNPATSPGYTSALTVNIASTVAAGNYTLTIQGIGAGITRTTTVSVAVQAFTLGAAPNPVAIQVPTPAASPATGGTTVTITPQNGFSGTVNLSTSALPAGVTATFTPASATTTSTLTFSVTSAAAPGSYPLTITGTNGTLIRTTPLMLTLGAAPTYSLSLTAGAGTTDQGGTAFDTATVNPVNGFSNFVALTLVGAPAGITAAFVPPSTTTTSAMTISVAATVAPGNYALTVQGIGGGITKTATFNLTVQAFTLGVASTPLSIQVPTPAASPASGSGTVTITPQNGFSKSVALSLSALPAGVTATFTPASATTTSTLTFRVTNAATPGSYPLTITGTDGTITRTASLSLTLTTAPDFNLSTGTPLTLEAGTSAATTAQATALNGFSSAISLSASGMPAGMTVTFGASLTSPGYSTSLTVATTTGVGPGTYTLTITGTGAGLTHSTTLQVAVTAFTLGVAPTLNIQVPTPAASPATGGTTVTVTPQNGYANGVALSLSALPAGVTAVYSPASATSPGYTSTLTFSVTNAAAPGSYPLTLTGTDGILSRTTSLTLNLSTAPTYTLSLRAGAGTTVPGGTASDTVTANPVNGFSSPVTLSLVGAPAGITATFAPNPATSAGGYTSALTVNIASTVAAGTYSLTVQGLGGGITQTATFTLTVQDFSLSLTTDPVTVINNSSAVGSTTLNITDLNGFSGAVTFSASGVPSGLTLTFGTNPATTSALVTVNAGIGAPAGDYPVTITGTGGGVTHTINLTIHLVDFTVSASPAIVNILRPQAGLFVPPPNTLTSTVTVTPQNGFNSAVTFSNDPLASGTSVSYSPTGVTGSGTSTATFSVTSSATPGRTGFNLYGNSTGTGRSFPMALNVMDFLVSTTGTSGTVVVPAPGQAPVTTTIPFTVDTSDYYGTINLAAVGLPAGASATFSTGSSITLANSTASIPVTMTITVPVGTATGSFNIQMQGTDSAFGQSRTSNAYTLTVNPAEDFSLSSKPSVVTMETTAFVRGLTLTGTSTGFAGTVNVTQSGAPAGMTINLGGGTITMPSGGSGGLTYTVATAGVPAGTYPITFTASGTNSDGPISHSTVVTITVVDYTMVIGTDPLVLLDTASTSANTQISIASVNASPFTDTVTIQSVTGAPANVTTSFTSTPLDTATPGTITFMIAGTVVGGNYTITVTGMSAAGVTHTQTFTLQIQAITIAPRIVATTSTGIPVHVIVHGAAGGSTGTGTIDGTWLGGYTGNIALSDTGGGLYTFAFAPATLVSTGPTSSTMTVTVMPTGSAAGTYTNVDTIVGNSPPLGATASVNLTVEDYTASGPGVSTATGTTAASEAVTLTRLPVELPFDEDIILTANDATGTWTAAPVTVTNPGTSGTLNFTATTAKPATRYLITVTATSTSGVVHSFTFVIQT